MATHANNGGNALVDVSNAMVQAVQKAGGFTLMVSARRRRPASGVAYAADLVLTADHVVEREEGIKVFAGGELLNAALIGRDPVEFLPVHTEAAVDFDSRVTAPAALRMARRARLSTR